MHRQSDIRQLLDQRNARADLHRNTPPDSPQYSDSQDTPSIYSRAFYSPRPSVAESSSGYRFTPKLSGLGTNRDHFDDPATSILDLEDDRSSWASADTYSDDDDDAIKPRIDQQDDEEQEQEEDEEDQAELEDDASIPRMSLLGPKMKFHSRAPWEMDQDTLNELEEDDQESDNSANYLSASRGRGNVFKNGLGFRSASPKTTNSRPRPSGESSRSQSKPKDSFESANPRRALQALAQASLSSNSLIPPVSPARNKFSIPGIRTRTHSATPQPPTNDSSSSSSPRVRSNSHFKQHSNTSVSSDGVATVRPRDDQQEQRHPSLNRPAVSFSDSQEDPHPYANPDLASTSYTLPASPRREQHMAGVSRSDSIATITDSQTDGSFSKSPLRTISPDTSVSSTTPPPPQPHYTMRKRASTMQNRGIISSPMPIQAATMPAVVATPISNQQQAPLPPMLGWTERSTSPTFTLISLEEARAQRTRSATAHAAISYASNSIDSSKTVPFPEHNEQEKPDTDSPSSHSGTARSRARSISAGVKAKYGAATASAMPRIERRDSEPDSSQPTKALKHKKSGFMRLFNGRDKDREEKHPPPPPVPSLADGYAAFNAHQAPAPPKITTRRVPAPLISPSMMIPDDAAFLSGNNDSEEIIKKSRTPSPKRLNPALSINTSHTTTADTTTTTTTTTIAASSYQTRTAPSTTSTRQWQSNSIAQSAPAHVTDFPALKLRPVSTIFSSQFAEHMVSREPSLEADSADSLSPSTATFPLTPGLFLRPEFVHMDDPDNNNNNGKICAGATANPSSDDQSSVVRALQEQIISAKRAWQRNIWELEGQVRDLKAEVEDLRAAGNEQDYCDACGRGKHRRPPLDAERRHVVDEPTKSSIATRPRARTGTSARFASGN